MTTPALSPAPLGERKVSAPAATRTVELQPSSWNAEQRTIGVVWTTGSRGAKFDWETCGLVDEELATGSQNVRLGRLNGGAPVLNTHKRGDLAAQIGVVVPGSARMENGRGVATLQLSDRADLAPIVADIAAGIIRNLSVGYTVHAYDIEQRQGQRPLYRAVDWEPFEISFVPVPFDAAATVRSGDSLAPSLCTLRTLTPTETAMPARHQPNLSTDTPAGAPPADAGGPATIAQLRELVSLGCNGTPIGADQQAGLVLELAERGLSQDAASREIGGILAERQRNEVGRGPRHSGFDPYTGRPVTASIVGGQRTYDDPNFLGSAIEDALFARMSGRQPSEQARAFMGRSMVELAADMLERRGVGNVRTMSPSDILSAAAWNRIGARAMFVADQARGFGPNHTTSDFPDLLLGAGQRFLLDQFTAAASVIKLLSRERSARDFRTISGLQLSGFGTLEEVGEDAEIKSGSFKERKETYRLKTFAKQFGISRQALINDDLNAFGDPMRVMARAAAETEAQLFAELINNNPALADGKALFHADHGNLAGAGAAPDVETLGAGRLAMRSQKDADGVTPLACAPKYVLASPKRETAIEQLLVATTVPTSSDEANPFAGKLTPLIEPRLAADPWYLFADPQQAPTLEHAYLDSTGPGPHVEMQEGWDTLGTKFRVYMDFGCGLVDHRGGYKNPGA
ncbi:MAG: prohead protease/major capsid protein fusion protein [Allosphingosinicella sp.]